MSKIFLDHLRDKTSLGLQVKRLAPTESFEQKAIALGPHRDDHYVFFLLEGGAGFTMVDLQEVRLEATQLFYILPGQVHYHIKSRGASGWFLAVDRSLVSPECRNIFEGRLTLQSPCTLAPAVLKDYAQLLTLLDTKYSGKADGRFYMPVVYGLLQSFLSMAAASYDDGAANGKVLSRPAELSRQFKMLMTENIRVLKSPSGYAARLHISTAYLNEAIRKVTGLSSSYWIKQEILMEAKRLLYHSDLNIKQVASELGYEDPAYFSRFFSKEAGLSAIEFRELHRK